MGWEKMTMSYEDEADSLTLASWIGRPFGIVSCGSMFEVDLSGFHVAAH